AADRGQQARPIHLVDKADFAGWLKSRPAEDRTLLDAQRFTGETDQTFVLLPRGGDFEVVAAVRTIDQLSPWCVATLSERLPEGTYKLSTGSAGRAALGWLLGQHRFDDYRSKPDEAPRGRRILVVDDAELIDAAIRLADATALVRDLVNTPAGDLGPAELEKAARQAGNDLGAAVRVTTGKDLAGGYPLIAAVGSAATEDRA